MRWDNLFDDLESQLENELNADEVDLRAEEERLRLGRLSLRSRLTSLSHSAGPGGGTILRIVLVTGDSITLRPTTFGKDWLAADLMDGTDRAQCVLPLSAVAGVILAREQVGPSLADEPSTSARVVDRIGIAFVVRDLCRRRRSVEIRTPTGSLNGTIDRVGRDHLDLAVHDAGTLRRSREVRQYRLVPFSQIALILMH